MPDNDLTPLLKAGELDIVEFKESLGGNSPTRIREAICAFANDLPDRRSPGYILVGVRDDGMVTGLPITDELLRQLADMKTDGNIVPPPSMTVDKRLISGKEVAVVTVQPSDSPPVRYDGRIHIRVGTRRGLATAQDERILNEKRRYRDIPFDIHPMASAMSSDLDLSRFTNEYLPQAFAREVLEANERDVLEQLAATKMIASAGDPTPTVLGILVLGKNPQDFIPGAYIQFLKLDSSELDGDAIVDSQEIRGAVADIIRRLDEKLASHNRVTVDIISGPLERRTNLYPLQAVQQITRNAIMHRSYESTNAPVSVHWYNDRIEVINPGGRFGDVTADNFGHPGVVDYRNPNLAEAMRVLGLVQRFGVGIQTARRLLRETGHPEPVFDVSDTHVFVKIRSFTDKR